MKTHSTVDTQALLKKHTSKGTQLRQTLLSLQRGESLTITKSDWPFKSPPAEYLYTMKRVGRTYSYKRVAPADLFIVRTK